ncbi:Bax inhibitor-1/YccA family protein [Xanthovirga aplysinae]|uniref:Bax inhibitor-1/YccA family protein n=1 Tax=Xanthovirga aplysinae TaxID=2529853 RepID=UPI0012BD3618|nr:Bax inhibitor-1/YccA family protein [Xanthovirga aplysinae]MTI31630.1 Bax inhibitor-1/YccA family protein [Xanthovirga aplysinae]
MAFGRSSNPTLKPEIFSSIRNSDYSNSMTVQGTVNKTLLMLALVIVPASYTWGEFFSGANVSPYIGIGGIGGFIFALITIFKKEWAPITAPIYAILEGLFLGALSANIQFQNPVGDSIVMQAVVLTFGTFFTLLIAYKAGWIKVTDKFRMGLVAATGGVALVYFISFIMSFFGGGLSFLYGSGMISIGFSLVVVVIAALNLVMDFDFIERGANAGAPKYMEWYAAFGLMVTLIWLYIEILRLLSKLNSRRN